MICSTRRTLRCMCSACPAGRHTLERSQCMTTQMRSRSSGLASRAGGLPVKTLNPPSRSRKTVVAVNRPSI
ncbi:hypothetical protein L915_04133 [Phytophthora nicotianae]|uniref:Uncharacterized protein n=1 Tax=Phytophthora nicotianae TaxID=4792 RepID=W2HBD0_PHYNI|nr:hypothetical protein L915_04133 [Phytophthora nicotianae]